MTLAQSRGGILSDCAEYPHCKGKRKKEKNRKKEGPKIYPTVWTLAICVQNLSVDPVPEAGITLSGTGPEEMVRYTDLGTRIFATGQLLSEKLETTLVPNENEPIMLLPYNRILSSY